MQSTRFNVVINDYTKIVKNYKIRDPQQADEFQYQITKDSLPFKQIEVHQVYIDDDINLHDIIPTNHRTNADGEDEKEATATATATAEEEEVIPILVDLEYPKDQKGSFTLIKANCLSNTWQINNHKYTEDVTLNQGVVLDEWVFEDDNEEEDNRIVNLSIVGSCSELVLFNSADNNKRNLGDGQDEEDLGITSDLPTISKFIDLFNQRCDVLSDSV